MNVIVPAKADSSRCLNKNFRPFHKNKSLLDIKIEQLLDAFEPGDIFISSDAEEAKVAAQRYGVEFVLRDDRDLKADTMVGHAGAAI